MTGAQSCLFSAQCQEIGPGGCQAHLPLAGGGEGGQRVDRPAGAPGPAGGGRERASGVRRQAGIIDLCRGGCSPGPDLPPLLTHRFWAPGSGFPAPGWHHPGLLTLCKTPPALSVQGSCLAPSFGQPRPPPVSLVPVHTCVPGSSVEGGLLVKAFPRFRGGNLREPSISERESPCRLLRASSRLLSVLSPSVPCHHPAAHSALSLRSKNQSAPWALHPHSVTGEPGLRGQRRCPFQRQRN